MAVVVITSEEESSNLPPVDYQFEFSLKKYHRVAVGKVLSQIFFHPNGDSWQLRLKKIRRSRKTGKFLMECRLQLITLNPNDKCKLARLVSYSWDIDNTTTALFTDAGDNYDFGNLDDVKVKIERGDFILRVEVLTCIEPMLNAKPTIEYPKSQMFTAEVSKWFESEDFGDTIMVAADGKRFRCHRDILSARSEVFKLMFNTPMKESKENLVKIDDFDGQIVSSMLQFVYSDECSEVGPIADRLYAAAHRYELRRLKSLCTSALAANLSENSVVTKTQQLAELYDLDDLKLKCDNYWGSQTGGKAIVADYFSDVDLHDDTVKLDSKYLFSANYFQRWELGKVVLSNPFTLWCSWQLKLTKTGNNQVRCQLQLVDVLDDWRFPQIATVRLVEDNDIDYMAPLVCFYQTGDKFNFGPFEVDSTTNHLTVEVEIVEWEESKSDTSDMASDVRKWIESEDFGDTTVVANDGKKFRCHRDIFERRCEGFRLSKFSRRAKKAKKNDENVVDIKCFDGKVVSALLQFFYTDHISRYDDLWSTADHVYLAADQYKLDRLKLICEFAMANSLSVDSVMKIYRLATVYHLNKLLAVCVDYLDTHKAELNIGEIVAEAVQIGEDK